MDSEVKEHYLSCKLGGELPVEGGEWGENTLSALGPTSWRRTERLNRVIMTDAAH
jgi:hypothetical protein